MKRLLIGLTGLVALTISSCALSILATAMPKDLIYQQVDCPMDGKVKAEDLQVVSTQKWAQGIIILYSALCPGKNQKSPMQTIFGHKVVKRNGISWQVTGGGSYRTQDAEDASDQLVKYGISKSVNKRDRYVVLYGQVLKPKVAIVEVTFNNGKIQRDWSNNGAFVLLASGATGVCELRLLGSDNQILRQETLAVPKPFAKAGQTQQCLPVTQQL
ncbi:hypothetical protein K9N68_23345 [Kovacikia minuta CCNUW1]|uniref:hypothetical protein n=1 Tax=Kovacikia minuta TaxID=2931930 RepID=UPI001CCDCBA5|nr:hypothetical protein [Kovacikia minuta]UBF24594.1 hypothetical protein K9N68_23345 [Kovacikia minuta CCNUW1]